MTTIFNGRYAADIEGDFVVFNLLVNNAGVAHASLAEETTLADAQAILDTNFWGAVRVTNAVLPTMRKQQASKLPKLRCRVGSDAVWVPRIKTVVPSSTFNAQIRKRFGL